MRRSFEIKVYGELLTGHMYCEHETALEFLDWVDESNIDLWEPGKVEFDGTFPRWDTEKRRRRVLKESCHSMTTLWFLGPPDLVLLLKLRWHDHFSGILP